MLDKLKFLSGFIFKSISSFFFLLYFFTLVITTTTVFHEYGHYFSWKFIGLDSSLLFSPSTKERIENLSINLLSWEKLERKELSLSTIQLQEKSLYLVKNPEVNGMVFSSQYESTSSSNQLLMVLWGPLGTIVSLLFFSLLSVFLFKIKYFQNIILFDFTKFTTFLFLVLFFSCTLLINLNPYDKWTDWSYLYFFLVEQNN